VRVQSLVGELRSHMPCSQNIEKQKQYCNRFNKDFKSGSHKKKKKKKLDKKETDTRKAPCPPPFA